MTSKIGVLMDPIENITIETDTSFAILLEATKRHFEIFTLGPEDLFYQAGTLYARLTPTTVQDDNQQWFKKEKAFVAPISTLDMLHMRKDPPFNREYVYLTQLLELAERAGVLVVNRPQALRDANEKLFTTWFAPCAPPTLVSRAEKTILDFYHEQGEIIIKPLEGKGGKSVFYLKQNDPNIRVIIELLTKNQTRFVMAQTYIPAIKTAGDRRIILINGEPIPYALARIPPKDDHRGNLAIGAKGIPSPITDREKWICQQIGPTLKAKGLWLVGIDVIGDYLTEINVTSPTGARELDAAFNLNIAGDLFDFLATLKHPSRS